MLKALKVHKKEKKAVYEQDILKQLLAQICHLLFIRQIKLSKQLNMNILTTCSRTIRHWNKIQK